MKFRRKLHRNLASWWGARQCKLWEQLELFYAALCSQLSMLLLWTFNGSELSMLNYQAVALFFSLMTSYQASASKCDTGTFNKSTSTALLGVCSLGWLLGCPRAVNTWNSFVLLFYWQAMPLWAITLLYWEFFYLGWLLRCLRAVDTWDSFLIQFDWPAMPLWAVTLLYWEFFYLIISAVFCPINISSLISFWHFDVNL